MEKCRPIWNHEGVDGDVGFLLMFPSVFLRIKVAETDPAFPFALWINNRRHRTMIFQATSSAYWLSRFLLCRKTAKTGTFSIIISGTFIASLCSFDMSYWTI